MDLGILYNLTEETLNSSGTDQLADLDVLETATAVQAALEANGHKASTINFYELGFAGLKAYDAVFNLTERIAGNELGAVEITDWMERNGILYCGEGARTLAWSENKAWAKSILIRNGLPTARYQVFGDATNLHTHLSYPLIVKPLHEDGSAGINENSVVQDLAGLTLRVGEILSLYKQPALVEEYIDGREIHAAVLGNNGYLRFFPLVETVFHTPPELPRIMSYDAKWVPGSTAWQQVQPGCQADLDEELEGEIKRLAARVYRALDCRGYTRVEFRLRGRVPYVLEVNPNPCINPRGSSFIASAEYAGFSYEAVINAILEAALPE
jgi:D-alanine-D-alanine ligase